MGVSWREEIIRRSAKPFGHFHLTPWAFSPKVSGSNDRTIDGGIGWIESSRIQTEAFVGVKQITSSDISGVPVLNFQTSVEGVPNNVRGPKIIFGLSLKRRRNLPLPVTRTGVRFEFVVVACAEGSYNSLEFKKKNPCRI